MNRSKKIPKEVEAKNTKKVQTKAAPKPKVGEARVQQQKAKPKKAVDSDVPISPSEHSDEAGSKSSSSSSNSSGSASEEESSISQAKQIAVKNMEFRSKRGEKMKYLINRKKEQEDDEDDFWRNNKYFGDDEQLDKDDEEDYVQSSSGQDEFDSDFLSNDKEEQEDNKAEEQNNKEEQEQDKTKKRKGQELQIKKPTKKVKKPEPEKELFKYIHEEYTQQQLLAEAAHTQYFNLISLRRLISLEEEKKVYEHRQHTLDPPKIVYKDSNRDGHREQTITLVGYPPETSLFDIKE